MNRTNWEHGVFALIIQAALAYWLGWGAAGAVAVAVFFGREYSQVEYKVRSRTGRSLTDMMPWHVMRPGLWTKDGVLDVVVPAALVTASAYLIPMIMAYKLN